MSQSYLDLPETNFPQMVDTFDRATDVTIDLLPLVKQYQNLYNNNRLNEASQLLIDHPELQNCMINAKTINEMIISTDDFDFDVMGDNPACEEEITENSNEDEDDLASLLDQNEFVPQNEPVSVPNQTMSSQNQASIDDKLQLAEQKLQEAENLQLSALDTANKVMESVIDAQKVAQKIAEEQQNLIEEQKNQLNEQIELSKNQEEQEEESLNDI